MVKEFTLEKYVEELDKCPDDELYSRLGVYDNYAIYIKADLIKVLKYFSSSEDYIHRSSDKDREIFDVKGKPHVFIQIWKMVHVGSLTQSSEEDYERQQRDYNLTIMINGLDNLRDNAIEAKKTEQYLIKEKIPACLSLTNGKELFTVYYTL